MSKIRVSTLAREMGVPARKLLADLAERGIVVKSAASSIDEVVAAQLRGSRPAPRPSPPASQCRPVPASPVGAAAAIFGVEPRTLRLRRPTRTKTKKPPQPPDPWLVAFFDPAEKREWLLAGLKEHESLMAAELRDLGIRPSDLRMILPSGRTPLECVRQGDPLQHVKQYVRRAQGSRRM